MHHGTLAEYVVVPSATWCPSRLSMSSTRPPACRPRGSPRTGCCSCSPGWAGADGADPGRRRRRRDSVHLDPAGRPASGSVSPPAPRSRPARVDSARTRRSRVRRAAARRVDAVMETVGEATWSHSSSRCGRAADRRLRRDLGTEPPADLARFFFLQLARRLDDGDEGELRDLIAFLHATGLRPHIDRTLPWNRSAKGSRRWPRATSSGRSSSRLTGAARSPSSAPRSTPALDEAVWALARAGYRDAGIPLPPRPPHRPHFSLAAARVRPPARSSTGWSKSRPRSRLRREPVPVVLTRVGRFGRAGALWLGPAPTRGLSRVAERTSTAHSSAPAGRRRSASRSAPNLWVAHCTLATRVAKPLLRDVQGLVANGYEPIRGVIDALAVILVGGRGDVAHLPLAPDAAYSGTAHNKRAVVGPSGVSPK